MKSLCSLLLVLFLTATNLLASNTPLSMTSKLSLFAIDGNTPTSRSSNSYDGTSPAKTSKTKEAKQHKKASWFKKTGLKKRMKKSNQQLKFNTDAKADWAGIVSITTAGLCVLLILFLPIFSFLLALVGIIFGTISLIRIKNSDGELKGYWMGIIGITIGAIVLLLTLVLLLLVIAILL